MKLNIQEWLYQLLLISSMARASMIVTLVLADCLCSRIPASLIIHMKRVAIRT